MSWASIIEDIGVNSGQNCHQYPKLDDKEFYHYRCKLQLVSVMISKFVPNLKWILKLPIPSSLSFHSSGTPGASSPTDDRFMSFQRLQHKIISKARKMIQRVHTVCNIPNHTSDPVDKLLWDIVNKL